MTADDLPLQHHAMLSLGWALESLLPALVAVWLAGVLVLSLRLLGGWAVVQRLPRRGTRPISGELTLRVTELARRLGISRSVRLLESAVVPVPTVMGCLRAVILVPAGAISGAPPQQLEALLAHELAHVRRHDSIVNLLQAAMETLLFYHPGVWWRSAEAHPRVRCQVSQRIRMKRENCCDDLAMAALGDWQATVARLTYARALAAVEELRRVPAVPAGAGRGTTGRLGRPTRPSSWREMEAI